MAKYLVTGALVQVKANTADGGSALVYVYRGGIVELDKVAAEHLLSVNLVQKFDDGATDPVVAAGPASVVVPEVVVRPADDADKAVWEAFAVRSGLSQADAEKASQEDLVAIFGGGGLPTSTEVAVAAEQEAAAKAEAEKKAAADKAAAEAAAKAATRKQS